MDSESLKIFCAVAAELSITQAAVRLGRAPSNVTTRIQQLEADIGTDLFVRTGKRIALSGAGEQFLDYAKRILALEEEARHVITGGRDGGMIRIGSMESTAASRMPSLLAAYHSRHRETRLELSTGPSRKLIEQVRTGKLDCAFATLPLSLEDVAGMIELGLQARTIWTEELLLLLPASESQARSVSDIRTRSLAVFPQGCTYRSIADEWLGVAGSTDWQIQEMSSYHSMIAFVSAGVCVTVLPKSVLKLTAAPEELNSLPLGPIDTCLIWRDNYDVPAFKNLLSVIEDAGL